MVTSDDLRRSAFDKVIRRLKEKEEDAEEIVSSIEREPQWNKSDNIVSETEVRDHTVQMDVMQGAAAVQSQTRMKQQAQGNCRPRKNYRRAALQIHLLSPGRRGDRGERERERDRDIDSHIAVAANIQ